MWFATQLRAHAAVGEDGASPMRMMPSAPCWPRPTSPQYFPWPFRDAVCLSSPRRFKTVVLFLKIPQRVINNNARI